MTDQDRIEALFEAGRITREQADQLLAALNASDSAEREVDSLGTNQDASQDASRAGHGAGHGAADREAQSTGQLPLGAAASLPDHGAAAGPNQVHRPSHSRNEAAAAGLVQKVDRDTHERDSAFKWLDVDTFAGNLEITVNESLTEPEVDEGQIMMTGTGARIAPWDQDDSGSPRSFLDRVIDGFRSSNMSVRIPGQWAVQFDVKGGNIEVYGPLKAIKGHLRAGDLSVEETEYADVTVTAGEAEVGLRAVTGQSRIQVRVGQADVRILPGSNVQIDASVSIGDISAKGLSKNSRGLGAQASGHAGSGDAGSGARLDVSVVTGDVTIKGADHA